MDNSKTVFSMKSGLTQINKGRSDERERIKREDNFTNAVNNGNEELDCTSFGEEQKF
jgi:hypothetical protein